MKITEQPNSQTENIDQKGIGEILSTINQEDSNVANSVNEELNSISEAVKIISKQLKEGGNLIFVGAGTSGRLGVLQSAECPPTFGTPPEMVKAFIAGGKDAVFASKEGAEDNKEAGIEIIEKYAKENDVIVGISASGTTPYVIGALEKAIEKELPTISLSCNKDSMIGKIAKQKIEVIPGPEVITGSTRMKAGTSQKLVLDMLTTGTMISLGKVKGNLMINLQPKSEKLKQRAVGILMQITGTTDEPKAKEILESNNYNIQESIKFFQ